MVPRPEDVKIAYGSEDFMQAATRVARETGCTMTQAMSAVARLDPEFHRDWKAAQPKIAHTSDLEAATKALERSQRR